MTARHGKLRVGISSETGSGGALATTTTLVGALGDDIDVTLISSSSEELAALVDARPSSTAVAVPPVKSKADVAAIFHHVRAVRRLHLDVLHVSCNNPWTSPYCLMAGVMSRTPTIAVVHGPAPAWRRRQQWLVRRLAPHVAAYVSVSGSSSRATEAALALPPGSVRTIHNGVPFPTQLADAPAADAEPVIGAVSRLSAEKGLDVLVEAFALVGRGRLVLVGDGEDRARLEALVAAHEMTARVSFPGWLAGPWTAQWAFDVLVVPSRSEGFGLVAVEAMLAGVPIIATEVGGLPEVVQAGQTGLLVAPDDALALAAAITEVLDRPDDARRRADAAGVDARRRFSPAAMAAAYETLYRDVAGAHPESRK